MQLIPKPLEDKHAQAPWNQLMRRSRAWLVPLPASQHQAQSPQDPGGGSSYPLLSPELYWGC